MDYKVQLFGVIREYCNAITNKDYTRFSYNPIIHFRSISKSNSAELASIAERAMNAINDARRVNTEEYYNILLPILVDCLKEVHGK